MQMYIVKRARGRPRSPGLLTPAEWRVFAHLRAGRTNAEIARAEQVSVHTVRTQVSSILGKLNVSSRRALRPGELRGTEGEMTDQDGKMHCSFCMRSEDEVQELLAGASGARICERCVDACNRIIAEHRRRVG